MNDHEKKNITIRFYEELNVFLKPVNRKVRFDYSFWGTPSVKDIIESLGVPHTEVDLILVNNKSVNFDYLVYNGEDIAVYPVFESFDIRNIQHLRPLPLRETKFILDVHLGKLAKLLRFCGFDTYYKNTLTDDEIITISINEKRTILTRDVGILKNSKVDRGYFIRNTKAENQLLEVIKRFDLKNSLNPFSRCSICNSLLIPVEKKTIIAELPPKVVEYYNEFCKCEQCNKIYWRGSHFQKLNSVIKRAKEE